MQRIQNLLAMIICNNFDYIHSSGIGLVRSLKFKTIRGRRDRFLCVLIFKCIHGLAPQYLRIDVTMHVDIHGYDTRSAENMDLYIYIYIPQYTKEIYKRSFLYKVVHYGISSPVGQRIYVFERFKHNFRQTFKWLNTPRVHSSFYMYAYIIPYILILLFDQFCLHIFISGTYLNLILVLLFLCMIHIYECAFVTAPPPPSTGFQIFQSIFAPPLTPTVTVITCSLVCISQMGTYC